MLDGGSGRGGRVVVGPHVSAVYASVRLCKMYGDALVVGVCEKCPPSPTAAPQTPLRWCGVRRSQPAC